MRRPRIAVSGASGEWGVAVGQQQQEASERWVASGGWSHSLSTNVLLRLADIFVQPTSDSDTYAAVTVAAGATDAASAAYSPRIRSTSMSTMHAELCVLLAAFTGDRSHSDTPKNKTVAL